MTGDTTPPADVRIGSLRIHIAPSTHATRAGVLLYPTIMGLNDPMRTHARELADAGFTAVAWDPYDGEDADGGTFEMLARSRQLQDEKMVHDLTRIVDHMQGELGLTSIGGIGWCFGGRVALVHGGSDHRIRAVSAYNPTIWLDDTVVEFAGRSLSRADFPGETLDEIALAATIDGPVQICHPEHDFTPPTVYEKLLNALRTRPEPTIYEYYPNAEHGFSYTPGTANDRAHRFAWGSTLSVFTQSLALTDPT